MADDRKTKILFFQLKKKSRCLYLEFELKVYTSELRVCVVVALYKFSPYIFIVQRLVFVLFLFSVLILTLLLYFDFVYFCRCFRLYFGMKLIAATNYLATSQNEKTEQSKINRRSIFFILFVLFWLFHSLRLLQIFYFVYCARCARYTFFLLVLILFQLCGRNLQLSILCTVHGTCHESFVWDCMFRKTSEQWRRKIGEKTIIVRK